MKTEKPPCVYCGEPVRYDENECTNCWEVRHRLQEFLLYPANRQYALSLLNPPSDSPDVLAQLKNTRAETVDYIESLRAELGRNFKTWGLDRSAFQRRRIRWQIDALADIDELIKQEQRDRSDD